MNYSYSTPVLKDILYYNIGIMHNTNICFIRFCLQSIYYENYLNLFYAEYILAIESKNRDLRSEDFYFKSPFSRDTPRLAKKVASSWSQIEYLPLVDWLIWSSPIFTPNEGLIT